VAVSGAGPTLLALVPSGREEAVSAAVKNAYAAAGFAATLHVAAVDDRGARIE
jgi:homoserine kinase